MSLQSQQSDCSDDFYDILVSIFRTPDGGGNAGNGRYNVSYSQDPISVRYTDAVLRFRLTQDTPDTIVFTGMVTNLPGIVAQLSSSAISRDGRSLICTDVDTVKEPIGVTLQWIDGIAFSHDPQVGNIPVPPEDD